MQESTKIWLYAKSPFKNDYANVINFETAESMEDFFTKKNPHIEIVYEYDKFQYTQRNGSIVVSGRVEKYESVTYMRFINNGRTYYAFVFDVLYINEDATRIIYEVDVWNTYQHELKALNVIGQVEQQTLPNELWALKDSQQGFSVGTKYATRAGEVGIDTEWLVVVAKPTIKMTTKANRPVNMSYSGMQKTFKYFFIPVNLKSGASKPFIFQGKSYHIFCLEK